MPTPISKQYAPNLPSKLHFLILQLIIAKYIVYLNLRKLALKEIEVFRRTDVSSNLKKNIMNRNFFVFFVSLFTICLNAQVKISLKNTTGKRIDSLMVGGMYLGTLEKDSIKTISCERIACDSEEPILHLSAYIGKEKIVMDKKAYRCGTFLRTVTDGEYERNLVLVPIANGKNLLVALKKYR